MAEYYGNICTCRRCNGIVHTIRRGDTLYLLSRYYNVTVNEIMKANANVNVYNLQIGDQICIPVRRPNPTPPNILGQILKPNQNQNENQISGRPTPIQPRENMGMNMDDSQIMRNQDMTDGERMSNQSDGDNRTEGDSNSEYVETSASVRDIGQEMAECSSCKGEMKVKDLLYDDDMTLEDLAKMLKGI